MIDDILPGWTVLEIVAVSDQVFIAVMTFIAVIAVGLRDAV